MTQEQWGVYSKICVRKVLDIYKDLNKANLIGSKAHFSWAFRLTWNKTYDRRQTYQQKWRTQNWDTFTNEILKKFVCTNSVNSFIQPLKKKKFPAVFN